MLDTVLSSSYLICTTTLWGRYCCYYFTDTQVKAQPLNAKAEVPIWASWASAESCAFSSKEYHLPPWPEALATSDKLWLPWGTVGSLCGFTKQWTSEPEAAPVLNGKTTMEEWLSQARHLARKPYWVSCWELLLYIYPSSPWNTGTSRWQHLAGWVQRATPSQELPWHGLL